MTNNKTATSRMLLLLRYLFLLCLLAEQCVMDGDFENDASDVSSLGKIVGPRDFEALSGDLIVWTRLSPLNLSGEPSTLHIQLGLWQEQPRPGGKNELKVLQTLPALISSTWIKVKFECSLVVQGGEYLVRVLDSSSGESIANTTIIIKYPTIVFEVPHRIEAYTTETPISVGFTRSSSCSPRLPMPPTVLTLSMCPSKTDDNEDEEQVECNRDLARLYDNPLQALQKEGRIGTSVKCHLWARNSTFRVQLREEGTHKSVIAKSRPIRVEWGSQFSINMSKATVMPCRNSVRVVVGYPSCVLPGKDKIRVYGHETLSVPSLLVPSRLSYIGEQQIRPNNRVVTFRCNLFPQRFLRFCFQYINTAVDDSVAVVVEKCIPTNPPLQLSDGGWGPWSSWTPCTVTCGSDGKQYRYRFCDNPPPSSGANFCQGEAIDEKRCELPECPNVVYNVENSPPLLQPPPPPLSTESSSSSDFHHTNNYNHHQLNITEGCECGCILYDLVPSKNDNLVIFISPNHSSCAEDEVDQHKLKWILQAKEEKDRVRLDILEMDLQCVTITFRDGNTTDSNLLQMITSEEAEGVHFYDQVGGSVGGSNNNWTLESSGASLSIASASNRNCSGQYIYFIAYYSTVAASGSEESSLLASQGGPVGTAAVALVPFETFVVVKLVLLFFFVAIVVSGLGGCVIKLYRKEKYKELRCFEDEGGSSCGGGGNNGDGGREGGGDDSSRCTSVTLMSFDYTYWRRLRILRLKYFLLRPRIPPVNSMAAVKSFPTTPTRLLVKKRKARGDVNGRDREVPSTSTANKQETCQLVRSASLSERNLRVKEDEKRRSKRFGNVPSTPEEEERGGGGTLKKLAAEKGLKEKGKNPSRTILVKSPVMSGSDSSSETPTNESTSTLSGGGGGGCPSELKLLKEQENLKRRASREKVIDVTSSSSSVLYTKTKTRRNKKQGSSNKKEVSNILRKRDELGKSDLSVATGGSSSTTARCSDDSESRGASRMEDADHDFEMDYYDYDVMNVGTIPGSYLGLEPAFVLWNSEVYSGGIDEEESQEDEEAEEEDDDVDEDEEQHHLSSVPCKNKSESSSLVSFTRTVDNNDDDDDYDDGMEMMSTSYTTTESLKKKNKLLQQQQHKHRKESSCRVKETSLDTLKFADEDSDDNGTLDSDSLLFDDSIIMMSSSESHHKNKKDVCS